MWVRPVAVAIAVLALSGLAAGQSSPARPVRPGAPGGLDGGRDGGAPCAFADAGTLRFAVIGDFGTGGPEETKVALMVKGWSPAFVVTTGDNNYPHGEARTIDEHIGRDYASFIGGYRGRYGPGSATNRFWPVPGNHDWRSERLRPYLEYFRLPGNGRYYDVDLGLVHLYALDIDRNEPDGIAEDSLQARWLKQRMASSKACYDVVAGHQPPYSSGARHGSNLAARWPYRAWGAEVVLSGHEHVYERLEVDGLPYIVNGLGGASIYEFSWRPLPESKVRFRDDYGAMLVTATAAGITYEFFDVRGRKVDGLVVPGCCPVR